MRHSWALREAPAAAAGLVDERQSGRRPTCSASMALAPKTVVMLSLRLGEPCVDTTGVLEAAGAALHWWWHTKRTPVQIRA